MSTPKCPYRARQGSSERSEGSPKSAGQEGKNYVDYLHLPILLSLQDRLTENEEGHDEHFFIVIHQNFELWFKQILYEISSIQSLLERKVCEREQLLVLQRLSRINCIFRIMVQQFEVMETLSCVSFASFRDVFAKLGVSGFQSTQFRLLEHALGIKEEHRSCSFLGMYNEKMSKTQKLEIEAHRQNTPDLFTLIDKWLSRTPAVKLFITSYRNTIDAKVEALRSGSKLEKEEAARDAMLHEAKDIEDNFSVIFDSEKYNQSQGKNGMKLSYEAFMGALMINCHANEPRFSVPYEIIKGLIDMDVFFTKWKFAHAMMVKRMIGARPGTGGSGGYTYLRSTCSDRFMPFKDLFEIASYVIPPQSIPSLTPIMREEISQVYISDQDHPRHDHPRAFSLDTDPDHASL